MGTKQPERMCAVCRKKGDKNSLVRIVKDKSGNIEIDNSYKLNGRGAYICKNQECIEKAIKAKVINRAFKMQVDENVYSKLGDLL